LHVIVADFAPFAVSEHGPSRPHVTAHVAPSSQVVLQESPTLPQSNVQGPQPHPEHVLTHALPLQPAGGAHPASGGVHEGDAASVETLSAASGVPASGLVPTTPASMSGAVDGAPASAKSASKSFPQAADVASATVMATQPITEASPKRAIVRNDSTACAASLSAYSAESESMRLPVRRTFAALSSGVVALAIGLGIVGTAPAAMAADQDPTETVEAARFEFVEGSSHFQAKRWPEALRSFEHSFSLAPSPNTELMIARCLREMGRRTDAAAVFASAAAEALRRVSKGETKYAHTAEAAQNEGNALRSQLGTIRVHVARPAGVALTIDKSPLSISKEGDATVLHEPGTVSVAMRANGAEQRQTVTVAAGATVQMDFDAQGPPPKPEPAKIDVAKTEGTDAGRPLLPSRSWAGPAAIASGALTAAGSAVFVGFGVSSQSTFDALKARCGPGSCGPSDRAEADSGKRAQTIANVGVAVAAASAIATVVFVVMALSAPERASARRFDAFTRGQL
jgi:hypothetical protein